MTKTLLPGALLLPLSLVAQLSESFNDGNFTNNPPWTGSTWAWSVNAAGQLQSKDSVAGSTFYLATPNTLASGAEWELDVRLAFNPSSQNYLDVFLTASENDLTSPTNRGYLVRIGNTADEVALYRKDGDATVKLIDGADGTTDHSNNVFRIKVVRTAAGQFVLFRDDGARGSYSAEGAATDNTYPTSAYFGILVKQSTPSFFGKHYLDDITIKPYAPDVTPPAIRSLKATGATTLEVLFSEPVETASSTVAANYVVNNGIGAAATVTRDANNSARVQLTFNSAFSNGVKNTLTIKNVKDLGGNTLASETAAFGYYVPEARDVVVNELLFHPRTGGEDYVELYNRSPKMVDLSTLYLANRASSGAIASVKPLCDTPRYVLPGGYVVITKDAALLEQQYFVRDPTAVQAIPALPAYANEKGTVVVVDSGGVVMDEVAYSQDWQFALLTSAEGVALERIDANGPSGEKTNWHSAAASAGYGTPGYANSQSGRPEAGNATLEVAPKVFSPDGDGYDDRLTISYRMEQSGYVANVTLFDAGGRPVRYLVRNGLMGVQGAWIWDGLGEKGERLPAGTYVVYAELFNLQGKRRAHKRAVTLARRMD